MSRPALSFFLILLLFSAPAFADNRVTVEQLSRVIASSHGKRDSKIAERLYELELRERLNADQLAALEAQLPGPESRRSLVALADQAIFLDPPAAEIPLEPAPSVGQQREITAKAVDYVKRTLLRLPNLIARRDTIRFEDTPPVLRSANSDAPSGTFIAAQPLHPVSRSTRAVTYRNGEEIDGAAEEQQSASDQGTTGLSTVGEFGPILAAVFSDLPQGKLAWSHWEKRKSGLVAVFHFAVAREVSHYQVEFCCIVSRVFKQFAAYHGEIAVDPADGTILRLNLITDLSKADPIKKANLMVEYGPVVLGKQTFFCPVKSISVTVAPVQINRKSRLPSGATIPTAGGTFHIEVQDSGFSDAPMQTMLNEVVFDQYQLFASESRILTADSSEPAIDPNAITNTATATPSPSAIPNQPAPDENKSPVPEATTAGTGVKTVEAPSAESANAVPAPPAEGATTSSSSPEISVVQSTPLPQTPAALGSAPNVPSFSMRVNSRLVDLGITAFDKKGRPVTDLKRDDFVVFDNKNKQTIRSFSQTSAPSASSDSSNAAGAPTLYSNRINVVSGAPSAMESLPEGSTILLLDGTSLSFADLDGVRKQLLAFVDKIPAAEPVGLYVRSGYGFRVLVEGTTNHSALRSALKAWMPNAQDVARAQEEQMRNRQQFDTVQNATDMQYVNGNMGGTAVISSDLDIPGGGSGMTADPKLQKEGGNPTRLALSVVVEVAAHMSALPGHKNLVWVASQNTLSDWTDQVAGSDKESGSIARFALQTQEALNDAHVSLYPLDCSRLETGATEASLQNADVRLDPSADAASQNASLGDATPSPGGRAMAAMRQNLRPVNGAVQKLAQATGGRSFNKSENVMANLEQLIEDGHSTYLVSFAPDTLPDDKYHQLTVTVPSRRGVTLRYRAGYVYSKEAATLKDRFSKVVWQPLDATEIALSARWGSASAGSAVALDIDANDLSLVHQGDLWSGKLDIFLVQRDEAGTHAELKEQTLSLNLKSSTYAKALRSGIVFDQYVDRKKGAGSLRIIVVEENSGRIGSITLPAAPEDANP